MYKLLNIILLVSLMSCSPQARLARLLKHHPELTSTVKVTIHDTVRFDSTIVKVIEVPIPGITDTFNIGCNDTIIETKEFYLEYISGQLFVNVKPRKIYIHDTTKIKVEIPIEHTIEVPVIVNPIQPKVKCHKFDWYLYGFFTCIVLLVIYWVYRKFRPIV